LLFERDATKHSVLIHLTWHNSSTGKISKLHKLLQQFCNKIPKFSNYSRSW